MELLLSLPQILLYTFLFSSYLYLCFVLLVPKSKSESELGFKNYPLVGTLPHFLRNRHRFLDWTTGILSRSPTHTAVFRRPGRVHGVITANPANVEHILKANFENYPKGTRFVTLLEDFLGKGIFNSDAELWKSQRKTASYEFNTKSLRNFVIENVGVEIRTRLIPLLKNSGELGRTLDLQDVLERFAFDNICKLAFDFDPGCLHGDATAGADFMAAFEDACTLSSGRFMYALPFLYGIKKYFNIGSERRLRKAISTVHEFADGIIRSRMEGRGEMNGEDLLSRFIGKTADGSGNSAEFLRDIVISFILAGRDTTSSALTWFFWLLSSNPDVERKILEELEMIRGRTGKIAGEGYGFDELREMNYLHAAITESMRLFPPVPVDTKACSNDDVMPDGTFVGKDWFVTYHTYAMGRLESLWGKDSCEFRPDRWLENGICQTESPFRYPVFHAGPRMCLGKDLAYIQMKSIAASVIERFSLDILCKDKCPDHWLSLTLRMKGGLPVTVKNDRLEDEIC